MLERIILKQPLEIRESSYVEGDQIFIPAGLNHRESQKQLQPYSLKEMNESDRMTTQAYLSSTMASKSPTLSIRQLLRRGGR